MSIKTLDTYPTSGTVPWKHLPTLKYNVYWQKGYFRNTRSFNIFSYIIFSFDNFVLLKYNSSTCIQITKTMYQYNLIHQNAYTRILVLWIAY